MSLFHGRGLNHGGEKKFEKNFMFGVSHITIYYIKSTKLAKKVPLSYMLVISDASLIVV